MRQAFRVFALTVTTALGAVAFSATPAAATTCVSGLPLTSLFDPLLSTDFSCTLGPVTYSFSTDVTELAFDHQGWTVPVLNFSTAGNTQTLVWDQLNFVGTFNVGTAFSYTYVAELPYAVTGIVQTVVQTPVTPAGVAYSTWNGSSRITGNWVPPADVVYDDEGFPIGVTYLATLNSITHTITLGCAFTQCALPPPGTPGSTQSVPEPGTLGLALLALGATAAAGRRRRRAWGKPPQI